MSQATSPARSPLAKAVVESPDGIVVAQMLIVSDIDRSIAFYRDVLGAIVERDNPPAMLHLFNAWLILNVGGGPTEDKSEVTLTPPEDPNTVSSFLNIRVADAEAVYRNWSERGAMFIGPPTDRGPELRCYLRDPDGYLMELGQTKPPEPAAA
jgi:catechol 2,3-dioxygenase-like lactoylglutathione lyase family enzyme